MRLGEAYGVRVLCKAWHAITPNSFQLLSVAGLWSSDDDGQPFEQPFHRLSGLRKSRQPIGVGLREFPPFGEAQRKMCSNTRADGSHALANVRLRRQDPVQRVLFFEYQFNKKTFGCVQITSKSSFVLLLANSLVHLRYCLFRQCQCRCACKRRAPVGGRSSSKSSQACFMVSTR